MGLIDFQCWMHRQRELLVGGRFGHRQPTNIELGECWMFVAWKRIVDSGLDSDFAKGLADSISIVYSYYFKVMHRDTVFKRLGCDHRGVDKALDVYPVDGSSMVVPAIKMA